MKPGIGLNTVEKEKQRPSLFNKVMEKEEEHKIQEEPVQKKKTKNMMNQLKDNI